jgi:hypothetical protein
MSDELHFCTTYCLMRVVLTSSSSSNESTLVIDSSCLPLYVVRMRSSPIVSPIPVGTYYHEQPRGHHRRGPKGPYLVELGAGRVASRDRGRMGGLGRRG